MKNNLNKEQLKNCFHTGNLCLIDELINIKKLISAINCECEKG